MSLLTSSELFAAYNDLLGNWNVLIKRINAKGGEDFMQSTPFTPEEINQLITLCHPDKHDGKKLAVEMTQKLLERRS
ncbi:MAG: hypothetical protein COA47_10170 [Robiginitomaculum sp.]|nr:MAG: hypothetical protein COA47_10170 [Robiginitomaculum sp.]